VENLQITLIKKRKKEKGKGKKKGGKIKE